VTVSGVRPRQCVQTEVSEWQMRKRCWLRGEWLVQSCVRREDWLQLRLSISFR